MRTCRGESDFVAVMNAPKFNSHLQPWRRGLRRPSGHAARSPASCIFWIRLRDKRNSVDRRRSTRRPVVSGTTQTISSRSAGRAPSDTTSLRTVASSKCSTLSLRRNFSNASRRDRSGHSSAATQESADLSSRQADARGPGSSRCCRMTCTCRSATHRRVCRWHSP